VFVEMISFEPGIGSVIEDKQACS